MLGPPLSHAAGRRQASLGTPVSRTPTEHMDPMELSSLNELLDRIAALGVAMDYDRVGLKPDQREVNSPPVTHHIAVVEE